MLWGNQIDYKRPQMIRYTKHFNFPVYRDPVRQNKTKNNFFKTKQDESHWELVVLPKKNP